MREVAKQLEDEDVEVEEEEGADEELKSVQDCQVKNLGRQRELALRCGQPLPIGALEEPT